MTPSRPYLLRAIYEWLLDNKLNPQISIDATYPNVQVPAKYISNGKIVLNIAPQAVNKLVISNEWIEFEARFSGVIWKIAVPIAAVLAIYANGRGFAFSEQDMIEEDEERGESGGAAADQSAPGAQAGISKPHIRIVK